MVETVFKRTGRTLINMLTKMGMNIGLNILFAAAVNSMIYAYIKKRIC